MGGREIASSRVRAFSISDALQRRGIESECIVGRGVRGRARAIARLARRRSADVIVIQKLLYGDVMLRMLRAQTRVLVWECDDALHVGFPGEAARSIERSRRLIRSVLRNADIVTTTNPLLAHDLRPASGRVASFQGPAPLPADEANVRGRVLIWLGSPSTEKYLMVIGDVPAKLREHGWNCVAVGATEEVAAYGWRPISWSPESQIEWLSRASVGVMPQASDPWSDRKQGYKLFEYMAHGVVPVASDVLPARIVLDDDELRLLLVPAGGDWEEAIVRGAARRERLIPRFGTLLTQHSVDASVCVWLNAVGIGTPA